MLRFLHSNSEMQIMKKYIWYNKKCLLFMQMHLNPKIFLPFKNRLDLSLRSCFHSDGIEVLDKNRVNDSVQEYIIICIKKRK